MPEPLKHLYNAPFFEKFVNEVNEVLPHFDKKAFLKQIFNDDWEEKELKQRMRHVTLVLKDHLPGNYKESVALLLRIIKRLETKGQNGRLEYIFFPDYIEQFGLDDLDTSLNAIELITQFISCEFAIRPFLIKYPGEVMDRMLHWSTHSNHLVRRFSSEGCRPRLPWATAIPQLKKDPSPVLPILENLKNDSSLFVRKSVANNLNDIAKDNPDVVIALVKKWKGVSKETDWIIKHGCRTLLKKADENTYALFNLNAATNCSVNNFKLSAAKIKIGDRLGFSFSLHQATKKAGNLRIEYAVYYVKWSGKQTRKLFKISEGIYDPGTEYVFSRQQRFQDFTTRKHYPGKHKIGIVVNGRELAVKEFMLLKQ